MKAAALGPAEIHAKQHLRPILRLGAAGAWMDGHDRVLAIVLAAEHLLRFASFDFRAEIVEPAHQIVDDRLARLRPFDEDGEIVGAALQRFAEIDVALECLAALEDLLRRRLVLPEIGIGRLLFYLGEFVRGAGGVKDSSADRMRASRDPDIGGADRLTVGWT